MTPATRQRAHSLTVLVLAVALVAINLRPGATSVGPVLEEVRAGLSMGAGAAGVLTALPPLCFGLGGAVAVALARRIGLTGGIALGLSAATVAILLRVVIDSEVLFLALTVVALLSMALGNVLVPAWIKHDGAGVEVMLMTSFSTGLVAGGSLGALVTAPVAEGSGGWRVALGGWGALLALALPIWIWLGIRERGALADRSAPMRPPSGRIASSPTAVAMTALFGMQSMHAYIQFGWLPQIYRDHGLSATYAGALQALVAGVGILGSLVMPTVAARSRSLTPYVVAFGALLVGGYLGLMLAPTTMPWLWAVLLGVSGFAFPLTIALITARTRDPGITAQLSGFVQPVGYLFAAVGPFAVGLIHQATGGWDVVLVILMLTAIPFIWAGLRVARPVYVDDELA
ncbi:MAG: MFS transporter [Nocardioidaceae bacterium]